MSVSSQLVELILDDAAFSCLFLALKFFDCSGSKDFTYSTLRNIR